MPHELLTDEIVEKAARAVDPGAFMPCSLPDCFQCRGMRELAMDNARTALEAALPDLRRAFMTETDRHWRLKKRRVPKEKTHAA